MPRMGLPCFCPFSVQYHRWLSLNIHFFLINGARYVVLESVIFYKPCMWGEMCKISPLCQYSAAVYGAIFVIGNFRPQNPLFSVLRESVREWTTWIMRCVQSVSGHLHRNQVFILTCRYLVHSPHKSLLLSEVPVRWISQVSGIALAKVQIFEFQILISRVIQLHWSI